MLYQQVRISITHLTLKVVQSQKVPEGGFFHCPKNAPKTILGRKNCKFSIFLHKQV